MGLTDATDGARSFDAIDLVDYNYTERRAPSAERRAPSAERRAPSAERCAPGAGAGRPAGARRGLLRSARVLGVAACLALVGALVLPATAQAEVLVTNLGETSTIGGARLGPFDTAQGFSTGANAAGYVLTSIEVKIHTPPPTGKRVTAEVWTSSGGVPSARHATLIRPASIVAGNNTFWAHAGTTLAGDTTSYFVVLKSNDDTDTVKLSTTSSDDQGPDMTDWRIADNQRVKLR